MTETQCEQLLAVLQGAYPRTEFSDDTIDVYTAMLSDLDFKAAQVAVRQLIATSKWLPTIAEIRRAVMDLVDPLPSTEDAWIEVMQQARAYNLHSGRFPEFSHPVVAKAADAVGWHALCYTDNIAMLASQFRRAYESIRESAMESRQAGTMLQERPTLRLVAGGGEDR